ncbi:MAG: flagellin [Aquaspirillum sp.]|nr:flagellin [Aquaspirillum sp.]
MPQIINTNIMSLNSQRNLNSSQRALQTPLQRLSSGLRINSAKDDAAGLAISERLTSQIRGLNQAARNANDGISLLQTAEGSLGTVGDLLQRVRELAVQSANATNTPSDRSSLQREVSQLLSEVNRIAVATKFNGQSLLDGTFTGAKFQVGANANQTIDISIGSVKGNDIGNYRLRSVSGIGSSSEVNGPAGTKTTNSIDAQILTLAGNGVTATVGVSAGESAKSIADDVNAAGATTGVTAFAQTEAQLYNLSHAGTVTFNLYGMNSTAVSIAATVTTTDVSALATAVNAKTVSTGITAEANAGVLTLKSADGYDIAVENYTNSGAANATWLLGGVNPFTGGGVSGFARALQNNANDSATVGGQIQFNASSGCTVTTNTAGNFFAATTPQAGALNAVSAVDISTVSGANDALRVIDSGLTAVTGFRAYLGAMQNRFVQTVSNLQTTEENLSSARSRVRDADFAMETAELARAQILRQAGTVMLAQANQIPQNVLTLLR